MYIYYSDELGYVEEEVDEYGIDINSGKVYFNDKTIDVDYVHHISENRE